MLGPGPQLGQARRRASQLLAVAVLERRPPCLGCFVEPAPERVAGAIPLSQRVDARLLLAQAAGPEPLDQHAPAVARRGRRVDPLERERCGAGMPRVLPGLARRDLADGELGQASVACAQAAPARISAATQTASMISSGVAPCRRAALVCPLMQ